MGDGPASEAQAQAAVAEGLRWPAGVFDGGGLAFAWAVKVLGYARWNAEPAVAVQAAACLAEFAHALRARPGVAPAALAEVDAVAAWMDGIAALAQGRTGRADERLAEAAAGFDALGRAGLAAQVGVPRMVVLSVLGRHDDAARVGRAALAVLQAEGDLLGASKIALNLGNLLQRQGHQADALLQFRRAAALFARIGDRAHSVLADIGAADALAGTGDFDEAARLYARSVARADAHGLHVPARLAREAAALLALARGRYDEALPGLQAACEGYAALGLPQHHATAEKQLGDAYLQLRLLPEALALFDAAVPRFEALEMPVEQAWTQLQRARALVLAGEAGGAAAALRQADALFDVQSLPLGRAHVRLVRAEAALAARAPAEAVAEAGAAVQGFADCDAGDWRWRARLLQGRAWREAGRPDEAAAAVAEAAAGADRLGLPELRAQADVEAGLQAEAAGDDGAAVENLARAVDALEAVRAALPEHGMRGGFLHAHAAPYHALLRLALRAHARRPDEAHALDALQAQERLRARTLGDRLQHAAAAPADPALQRLRDRHRWLQLALQRADGDDAVVAAGLREVEAALLERGRRAGIAAAAPGAARPQAPAPQAWPHDAAVVVYGQLDDELFAWVLAGGRVVLRRGLARWAEVRAALQPLQRQLETMQAPALRERHGAQLQARCDAALRQLQSLVWQPLVADVAAASRLLVVPCDALAALPFAALPLAGGGLLDERFELALAPSLAVAEAARARPSRAPRRVRLLADDRRLPHAAAEARDAAALFDAAELLDGDRASAARLQAEGDGGVDVLHLACHARFRADNPRFSALELADGPLTVEAIQARRWSAAIVVLSACETALADQRRGDEAVGLVGAFLGGGASRVVASRWRVDDAATGALMRGFYAEWRGGATPAAALRAARAALRARQPHPFFWAAFDLHGGW